MKKLVHIVLAALLPLGIASAQSKPAVDFFGGYSYLNFEVPSSSVTSTSSQRLALKGWDFSASVGLFPHVAGEADFSSHQLGNCSGVSGLNCSNFSYMFGPRFTVGDRSSRITGFVHGLVGRDRITLEVSGVSMSDKSVSAAVGGGVDYWSFRHVGLQLGPVDFIYTNHLYSDNVPSQHSFRASAGIVFRFGGEFPPSGPKPPKEPKSESHRSWTRPWHKIPPWHKTKSAPSESKPPESQPSTGAAHKAAPPPASAASPGMPIHPLGIVAAPRGIDGAKILSIEPGSAADMASLRVGDLIKTVDGKTVRTPTELAAELADRTGKVRIGILRGDSATEKVILLGAH